MTQAVQGPFLIRDWKLKRYVAKTDQGFIDWKPERADATRFQTENEAKDTLKQIKSKTRKADWNRMVILPVNKPPKAKARPRSSDENTE
jgi:hypothetical protein